VVRYQPGRPFWVLSGQGVFQCLFNQAVFGKPVTGFGVEVLDFLGAEMTF
jgi:hypothetical protein